MERGSRVLWQASDQIVEHVEVLLAIGAVHHTRLLEELTTALAVNASAAQRAESAAATVLSLARSTACAVPFFCPVLMRLLT